MDNRKLLATSERLILRSLEPKDGKRLYEYRNQPDVKLFQGWTPENEKEVIDYAHEMAQRDFAAPGEWYQVVLELTPEENTETPVIGDVAFCIEPDMKKQAELGIAIDTAFHGKGYAQEAIKALTSYLFERFDLHRIHVSIDPKNVPSRKLFKRIGFREEGHLKKAVFFKGDWVDDVIMAVLKMEWDENEG